MRQRCHVFVMSQISSSKPHVLKTCQPHHNLLIPYPASGAHCLCRNSQNSPMFCPALEGFDDVPLAPNLRSYYFNGMNPSHTAIRGNSLKFSVVMAVYLKRCHGLNWSNQITKQCYSGSTHVYSVQHSSTMFHHSINRIKASVGLHDGEYGFPIYLGYGFQLQWWLFVPSQCVPGVWVFKHYI